MFSKHRLGLLNYLVVAITEELYCREQPPDDILAKLNTLLDGVKKGWKLD